MGDDAGFRLGQERDPLFQRRGGFGKGQADEARLILGHLLTMPAQVENAKTGGLQLMADQLRVAVDLAERMGNKELAQQLTNQRNSMLESHPYLQKRTVVSAMGHFGDIDPMKDRK